MFQSVDGISVILSQTENSFINMTMHAKTARFGSFNNNRINATG